MSAEPLPPDGSFAAGIRATELRPGRDVGTSLVTGVSDAQFELLKWYFVEVDDDTGFDAAADVIARAVAQVAPGTPVQGGRPRPAKGVLRQQDVKRVAGKYNALRESRRKGLAEGRVVYRHVLANSSRPLPVNATR